MIQNYGLMGQSIKEKGQEGSSQGKRGKSNSIIQENLGSVDNVPYFEGLPFIDYEDRENTWGNVFKGKSST